MGAETTASALAKEEEGKTSAPESAAPTQGSTQSTTENVQTKEETVTSGAPVTEATEEAEATTSVTDQVKDKILEVTAPVAAAAVAATAAVTELFNNVTGGESPPIPGTFPDTPAQEKTIDDVSAPTTSMIEEVKKSDGEPIPGVVVPSDTSRTFPDAPVQEKALDDVPAPTTSMIEEVKKSDDEPIPGVVVPSETSNSVVEPNHTGGDDKHNLETVAFETGVGATATGGFAAALEADKAANTPPTATHIPSGAYNTAPETNDSFGILPVPSETAPEGTKPLAKTVYKDEDKTANLSSLVPEPVQEKTVEPVPETKEFEPVTAETNLISSAKVDEPDAETAAIAGTAAGTGIAAAAATTATSHIDKLKEAALQSSQHAAQTAAKALSEDAPTPATLDAKEALGDLASGAGVTAIGTATDNESAETGLSRLIARKEDDNVDVKAEAKAAEVEPAIVLDDTKMGKANVETLGTSGNAAVASTPVKVTVPTEDGVQQVNALGTAVVTDGGEASQSLKTELLDSGKGTRPAGALAHLSNEETKPAEAPSTTKEEPETPSTPQKTPVTQSSAKKDNRASMSPSEPGSEKKKKKGFIHKLKKILS